MIKLNRDKPEYVDTLIAISGAATSLIMELDIKIASMGVADSLVEHVFGEVADVADLAFGVIAKVFKGSEINIEDDGYGVITLHKQEGVTLTDRECEFIKSTLEISAEIEAESDDHH